MSENISKESYVDKLLIFVNGFLLLSSLKMLKFIYIIKQKRDLKKVLRNHVLSLGGAGGNEY